MNSDYTMADLRSKIRKVARYVRLFGFPRTLAKIRGQYHLKVTDGFDAPRWMNPRCRHPNDPT